ncbi:MAG: glycosyltransferase involved in cell wall biosynthesis [Marinoscillum sp.]|jgi:glycosyltransferase involved in cell wall biosynthesis
MKVMFLAPYPLDSAPSQRFRFELFLKSMEEKGIEWELESFLNEKAWHALYEKGNSVEKAGFVLQGYLKRLIRLFRLGKFDKVFIHRELAPFGPPVFEWVIAKVLRKKIIYDFDDAIWLADQTQENAIWKTLKWRKKVSSICKWSWKVSAGNKYLRDYAAQFCGSTFIMPTVVDTDLHNRGVSILRQAQHDTQSSKFEHLQTLAPSQPKHINTLTPSKPAIGWTGSHSTLFYLNPLIPILQELEQEVNFEFVVIANKDPELPLKNYRFIKWQKETEASDLATIAIGLMPLQDDEWAQGKCGFKLIQYLSLGIPAIASPVGVNRQIISEGVNGFFATTLEEWKSAILKLINDPILREEFGKNGRQLIVDSYSKASLRKKFFSLLED